MTEKDMHHDLKIVAIGASAGGLEAFEILLKNMPVDMGASFIIVQHLSPDSKSILSEILQRYTSMPVTQITGDIDMLPDHVYVIPPNFDIGVNGNQLQLYEPTSPRGFRLPIDFLFRSVAVEFGSDAVGIVLSGTGSDGTLGIEAIKGAGGLTIVQDPATTKFNGMPLTAIATGIIDHVVPVKDMPDILLHYLQNRPLTQIEDTFRYAVGTNLQKVLLLIRDETGHDFSLYKPNTLIRRIERRMIVNRINDLPEYIQFLRHAPLEIDLLFHDLLIGVTSFFRDPDAFAALQTQVIRKLVEHKKDTDPIRIWVAGCSTGEEAISIAILVEEEMQRVQQPNLNVQIFATDIDKHAISKARDGIYPRNILVDVPDTYIQKYFITDDNHNYRIVKQIRRHLVFAEQSIIKDPPFSNIDLISCRNVLIYLTSELQADVINIFHYALGETGYLFLGGSESISVTDELFNVIHQRYRIFEKAKIDNLNRPTRHLGMPPVTLRHNHKIDRGKHIKETIQATLLDAYAPPSVIINESADVLYHQGDTSMFWATETGEASLNILRMARSELRPALTVGIRKALSSPEPIVFDNLSLNHHDQKYNIRLVIRALNKTDLPQRLLLISFEYKLAEDHSVDIVIADYGDDASQRVYELEQELKLKNEYLNSTVQELEASNEELQSLNEEFQSSNEELRSTNEELETSREELQAINEELLTMNAELNSKIEELDEINNDQKNILENVNVGLLILSKELHIRIFNVIAGQIFNLINTDTNRPLTQLASNFDYPDLVGDITEVVETLRPKSIEIEVNELIYLMQIHAYRTPHGDVDGSILTFTNVTPEKKIERRLRANEQKLQSIFDVLPVGISLLDNDRNIVEVNHALQNILKLTDYEMQTGRYTKRRYINNQGEPIQAYEFPSNRAIAEQKPVFNTEIGIILDEQKTIWVSVSAAPLPVDNFSAVVVTADITQLKRKEQELAKNEDRLAQVLINSNTIVFEQDLDLRYMSVFNPHPAFTADDIIGHFDTDLLNPDDATRLIALKQEAMETGQTIRTDFSAVIEDQHYYYDMIIEPRYAPDGQTLTGIRASALDITKRKQAEEANWLHNQILTNMAEGVTLVQTTTGEIVYTNPRFATMFGYAEEELIGQHVSVLNAPNNQTPSEIAAEIMQDLHENGVWTGEIKNIKKDGTPFWCYATVSTFNHHVYGEVWVSVHQDINTQKENELLLHYLEEQYQAVQNLQPSVAILVYNTDLEYTLITGLDLINRIGYTASQILGKTLFEVAPAEISAILEPHYRVALKGETVTIRYTTQNGIDVELSWLPLYNQMKQGAIMNAMLIIRDLTQPLVYEEKSE